MPPCLGQGGGKQAFPPCRFSHDEHLQENSVLLFMAVYPAASKLHGDLHVPTRPPPAHSGQGPCTGNSSSAQCSCFFLAVSEDSGYIIHVTDTQLVNVSLWGFGKDSELFRSLPVSSWDSASLPCYSQGAGESHKSSTALLSVSCILSPSTSLLIVITF